MLRHLTVQYRRQFDNWKMVVPRHIVHERMYDDLVASELVDSS